MTMYPTPFNKARETVRKDIENFAADTERRLRVLTRRAQFLDRIAEWAPTAEDVLVTNGIAGKLSELSDATVYLPGVLLIKDALAALDKFVLNPIRLSRNGCTSFRAVTDRSAPPSDTDQTVSPYTLELAHLGKATYVRSFSELGGHIIELRVPINSTKEVGWSGPVSSYGELGPRYTNQSTYDHTDTFPLVIRWATGSGSPTGKYGTPQAHFTRYSL